jgi:hypothetical protein
MNSGIIVIATTLVLILAHMTSPHAWAAERSNGHRESPQPVPPILTTERGALCRFPAELALTARERRGVSRLNISVPEPTRRGLVAIPSSPAARPSLGYKAPGEPAVVLNPHTRGTDLAARPFAPTHRVEGRIRFEYLSRGPDIIGSFDAPDFPQYAAADESTQIGIVRRATIILEDDQGHYIPGKLDENGEFSFAWNPVVGPNARITVWTISEFAGRNAAVGRWVGGPITSTDDLTDETPDYRPFGYTYGFNIANAELDQDGNGGLYVNLTISQNDDSAQAFWLLENTLRALDYFLAIDGVSQMPKINVVFTPELPLEGGSTAFYSPWTDPGFVFMPHNFGWLAFVVRHEVAHAFQFHYTRISFNQSYYGRLAEPLANAHSAAMAGSPWMDKLATFENLDAQANYVDEAFRLEDGDGEFWEYCDGCELLEYSYGWVQRVLWDLLDGAQEEDSELLTTYFPHNSDDLFDAGEFDLIDGGVGLWSVPSDHLLNDVLMNYLGGGEWGAENPSYEDRGLTDLDIVDVLDGFICRGHATPDQVDQLINQAMMFGYPAEGPESCN